MRFELENPTKVKSFYQKGGPLLERHPLLFYRTGFFSLLGGTLVLLYRYSK